jgi:DhnA family fructose-bisphosphate aldolase class Ia
MTPRVREILNWYGADSAGTLTNLSRLLTGTGKLVILPVQDALRLGCCAVGFTIYPRRQDDGPDHLARSAFVYIRQSTADQVLNNHESRRRQYSLAEPARQLC